RLCRRVVSCPRIADPTGAGELAPALTDRDAAAAGRDTFDAVYPLVGQSFDLADALRHADVRLERTAAAASRSVKAGASSPAPVGSAMRGQLTTRLQSRMSLDSAG
ncbi:MAG: hypothetical protein ACKOFH_00830, partial [Chthoniobacterales bacterium]